MGVERESERDGAIHTGRQYGTQRQTGRGIHTYRETRHTDREADRQTYMRTGRQ